MDASSTSGMGMIPSLRQADASYSENLKLYLSVLRDTHDLKDDDAETPEEKAREEAVGQRLGMSSRHPEDDTGMERWDGHDGLVSRLML